MDSQSLPFDNQTGRPRPAQPLAETLSFRSRTDARAPVSSLAAVRSTLPAPSLPHHPDWADGYWRDWSAVWSAVHEPAPGSVLRGPVLGHGSAVSLLESTVAARLGGYAAGAGADFIHLLDTFYAAQLPDGFVPRELDAQTGESCWAPFDPQGAGPNMLAWAEWRHFRLTGDEDRLRDVFRPILAYHRWTARHRTWPSGLYWSTGTASGVAAPPVVPDGHDYHQHWTWLDATLQANLSALLLGRMAELLGDSATVEALATERGALARRINDDLWQEATGLYHDTDPDGAPSPDRSMVAAWALLDRQLMPEDRRKILVQKLRDQHNSRRKIANGNGGHADEDPPLPPLLTTPLTTYMALRGLQAAGSWSLAHDMAVDALQDEEPAADPSPLGAAIRTLMLLEQVVGLSLDWPLRQVTWRNYLGHEAETGLRGVRLGADGTADLLAAGGVLTVRTDAPFTFSYRDREQEFQCAVPAGTSTFELT